MQSLGNWWIPFKLCHLLKTENRFFCYFVIKEKNKTKSQTLILKMLSRRFSSCVIFILLFENKTKNKKKRKKTCGSACTPKN